MSFILCNGICTEEGSTIKFAENLFVVTHFHLSIGQNNIDKLYSHVHPTLNVVTNILTGIRKLILVANDWHLKHVI